MGNNLRKWSWILIRNIDNVQRYQLSYFHKQELEYCRSVVLSVQDDRGVRTVIEELMAAAKQPSPALSAAAVDILRAFCDKTSTDYSDYRSDLFRGLICLFVRTEDKVLLAAWECLNTITKVTSLSHTDIHVHCVKLFIGFNLHSCFKRYSVNYSRCITNRSWFWFATESNQRFQISN